MTNVFVMTAAAAESFFELCLMREAVKEEERVAILQELADAGRANVFSANASKEEIVKALSQSHRVWCVSKRPSQRKERNGQ